MPLYEYQCESCEARFEKIQKFSDPPVEVCPTCGGKVNKLPASPAIQFKGSGFYITDYPKKSSSEASKAGTSKGNSESSSSSSSSESTTPKTDTPAAKKDT
ncbi:MAG TPA: FmdB family zinc ribbon protein [Vicinamibacterales bacterium]